MIARPRIAWCSSTPFPAVYEHFGRTPVRHCPWKSMLLERARYVMDAQWLVIAQGENELACDFTAGDTRYVVLGRRKRVHHWTYDWRGFDEAGKLLQEWSPSLVHVHGSENYFGLLSPRGRVKAPFLVSIQGLLGPYLPHVWGDFSARQIFRMENWRDLVRGSGLLGQARQWRLGSKLENEVLARNRWFAGRTQWDRAHLAAANPAACYREVGEVLRPEFAQTSWSLAKSDPRKLFFSNLSGPIKGGHVLLEALKIVRHHIPAVQLAIGGSLSPHSGYGRWLARRIERLGLSPNVRFVGFLEGAAVASHLAHSRVFVSASFADNSPNSVGEAMTVGTPCVCSYVGGIPSLGQDQKELAFFPSGDPAQLASTILQVMRNDELASALSTAGRRRALAFHDPAKVVSDLVSVYTEMLGDDRTGFRPQ